MLPFSDSVKLLGQVNIFFINFFPCSLFWQHRRSCRLIFICGKREEIPLRSSVSNESFALALFAEVLPFFSPLIS